MGRSPQVARDRLDPRKDPRERAQRPQPAPDPPLLALQRSAGNAAVAGLVQRKLLHDARSHVDRVEFTVGDEISLTLATKAQAVAAAGVNDAELRTLRIEALGDDTIDDNERMFLAGLLDAANASAVAAARIAAGTKFTFSRASIEAHMAHARDLDQQQKDPAIAAEDAAAHRAGAAGDQAGMATHFAASSAAVVNQMNTLAGAAWQPRLRAVVTYSIGKPAITLEGMLEAMLAAASDDTPGDRVMAAVVLAVAAEAGHPMAANIRAGRIQVDQVGSLPGGDFAAYRPTAGGGRKGDTVYVPTGLDINDLAHRSAVIHELTHADQDARSTDPKVATIARDQAELEAYRAGAKYQLEQTASLTGTERTAAVRSIAGLLNEISMLALILESRTRPTDYEPVIREVNAAWARRATDAQLARIIGSPDARITTVVLTAIRRVYGAEDASGTAIPHGNDLPVDRLSGESVLDWVDRT